LGSHDVIFSKPTCRRAGLLSCGVGRRERKLLLGRTGDLISTQQSCPRTLPAGTLLPATGHPSSSSALAHNLYHDLKGLSMSKQRPESSPKQAWFPSAGTELSSTQAFGLSRRASAVVPPF